MNARDKRLTDYGVPESECGWLYLKCQSLSDDEYLILRETAYSICPARFADDVLISLTDSVSYYVLRVIGRAKVGKNDFYAYRRKTAAEFYHKLKGDTHER